MDLLDDNELEQIAIEEGELGLEVDEGELELELESIIINDETKPKSETPKKK